MGAASAINQISPTSIISQPQSYLTTTPTPPTYAVPTNPVSAYSNISYPGAVGANSAIAYRQNPISPSSIPISAVPSLPTSRVNIHSPANVNLARPPVTSVPKQ
jgi:hypothetical protein